MTIVKPTMRTAPSLLALDVDSHASAKFAGLACVCGGTIVVKQLWLGQRPVICARCGGRFCDADLAGWNGNG